MTSGDVVLNLLLSLAVSVAGSGVLVVFLHGWLSERLKQSIGAEYARKLEDYKKEVELRFNDQVRLRKLYEEMSMSLEDIYGSMPDRTPAELNIEVHKLFALLALYAPDDIYLQVKGVFYSKQEKVVYGQEFRPTVYYALRKSIFGAATSLEPGDFVDNLEMTPVVSKAPASALPS